MDLDSGKANGTSNSSAYLEHRLLLKPEVAIDEHFSVKSTWNLFQLNSYPTSSNTTPTRFGSPLDSQTQTEIQNNCLKLEARI